MNTRDRLLLLLKNNEGSWISGEAIGKKLDISRNAVSKHVKNLRLHGYDIVSAPHKGYRLSAGSDVVSPDEIRDGLLTDVMGKKEIVWFKETGSTNIEAKRLADGGAEEGTLVIADNQLSGRGRLGRTWFSSQGQGIFLSIVLRPRLAPMKAARITLMTAVAVAETLISQTGILPTIKWPNDILVNQKKVAGILTELSADMDVVNHVIVGMGLNVNTDVIDFPREIRPLATSIHAETGKIWSRRKLIQAFLKNFEQYYRTMLEGDFEGVMKQWKALSGIIGKEVAVSMVNRKVMGMVLDVDGEGFLILKDRDGTLHRILSGDVHL